MKNSSADSYLYIRADRSSAIVLLSVPCPGPSVGLSLPLVATFAHFLAEPCSSIWICGKHSISTLDRPPANGGPMALGLSELGANKSSVEAERAMLWTEAGTPVSTLVSSSASSRRRWESDLVKEGRRRELVLVVVENSEGLLFWEE